MTDGRLRETDGEDALLEALVADLIDLRRAVTETLGREQYLYGVLDDALGSGHAGRMHRARDEYLQQPEDVRQLVEQARR